MTDDMLKAGFDGTGTGMALAAMWDNSFRQITNKQRPSGNWHSSRSDRLIARQVEALLMTDLYD